MASLRCFANWCDLRLSWLTDLNWSKSLWQPLELSATALACILNSAYQTEVTIEAIEVFDDQGAVKGVAFKLTNTDGVADLRGLFFDVAGETITSTTNDDAYPFNFSINSVEQSVDKVYDSLGAPLNWNVTQIATGENLVSNLKGGLNINGTAQNQGDIPDQYFYDMGIEFGTSGIGQGDDIR